MTTDRELMQQALDALEGYARNCRCEGGGAPCDAAEALCARLAQPEPEPVAWRFKIGEVNDYLVSTKKPGIVYSDGNGGTRVDNGEPLYTAPPQREWVGLTMEEMDALVEEQSGFPVEMVGHVLICAAEDKLKEKNIG